MCSDLWWDRRFTENQTFLLLKIAKMGKTDSSAKWEDATQTGESECILWYRYSWRPHNQFWLSGDTSDWGWGAHIIVKSITNLIEVILKWYWSDIEVILSFLIISAHRTYFEVSLLWEGTESHRNRPKGIYISKSSLSVPFTPYFSLFDTFHSPLPTLQYRYISLPTLRTT